ncbi:EAP30/Vps36 family-domain-containing protein [Suillus fuscotomentosus]|uniref:Vacuolar protein-sorting-associated protein 36 n=1 Tax=Suillus fuscotomentosus TaxID=1912939 RepID=A0AAD4HEW3_9AGAM|nr:EAP30/Vps36 family-domain-containing protein [Suillus fuscotomentosus]KAG1893967.1 EAP30/Vps36 family-domain-containing protein [Suillus fuscotomentosus]
MALRRYTASIDGTIPVPALLYDDEEYLASQDGVGIYDGPQKASDYQTGSVHVSTHRLFFVHSQNPTSYSFTMDLLHVTRTNYYAGLFKSSPKVSLFLDASTALPLTTTSGQRTDIFESWECEVCSHRNPPGLSPAAARICALCGVPRSASAVSTASEASSQIQSLFSSIPESSYTSLSSSSSPGPPSPSTNDDSDGIACPACTFLNHPSLRVCEICTTLLPNIEHAGNMRAKSAPSTRPVSPISDSIDPANLLIKLSFRKGGDKPFYNVLRRALRSRAWESKRIGHNARSGPSSLAITNPNYGPTPVAMRPSGIDGIMRNVEASAYVTQTDLNDALKDLEGLMMKAKDLVHLAGELNEKLTASSTITTTSTLASPFPTTSSPSTSGTQLSSPFSATTLVPSTEPEEAKFIRSSLAQLGLQMSNAPVTLDMIRDERRWVEELARELAGMLQGFPDDIPGQKSVGIMKDRGIVGLDEVWGGWNRARGVALIPPSTFLQVLPHLPAYTSPPIRSRVFNSGLSVLHIPPYTHASFTARIVGYLAMSGVMTTSQIAREENITIGLADEMIAAIEADGVICRDDERSAIKGGGSGTTSEVRWSRNLFLEYIWDGQL